MIERICDFKDRLKLFDVYTIGLNYSSTHAATCDSMFRLSQDLIDLNEEKHVEEIETR